MNRNLPFRSEPRSFSPIADLHRPVSGLVVRLHAVGDIAVTLPHCLGLLRSYPGIELDFLTHSEFVALPSAVRVFRNVIGLETGAGILKDGAASLLRSSVMKSSRYDFVLDLQRNWVTRLFRRNLRAPFWGEFDRFGNASASDRTAETIQRLGFPNTRLIHKLPIRTELLSNVRHKLFTSGWDGETPLLVLNPSGLWKSRNWPLEHYREMLRILSDRIQFRVLFIGTNRIQEKVRYLTSQFPDSTIDMTGQTDMGEALALLQFASLVVSEDSGLLQMAWASGTPTIALFGSTNHIWAAQPGDHMHVFHSGDLDCGPCMSRACILGDVRCLARISPLLLSDKIAGLLHAKVPSFQT